MAKKPGGVDQRALPSYKVQSIQRGDPPVSPKANLFMKKQKKRVLVRGGKAQ